MTKTRVSGILNYDGLLRPLLIDNNQKNKIDLATRRQDQVVLRTPRPTPGADDAGQAGQGQGGTGDPLR